MWLEYLKPGRTALVVVDPQNDFCDPKGFLGRNGRDLRHIEAILPKLTDFIAIGRRAGVRIVFIKSYFDENKVAMSMRIRKKYMGRTEDACPEGSWGSELVIKPQDDDLIIIKHAFSAFIGTSLEELLREEGIESLVITGVLTNVCCESTLRDAFMLGFNTVLLEDCCASDNLEAHNITIYNVRNYFGWVSTSDQLERYWLGDKEE